MYFQVDIPTHHEEADTSTAKSRDDRFDLGPKGINNGNKTNKRKTRLGLLGHLVLELGGAGLVLDVLAMNSLAGEKNASLALAAVNVLDTLDRGAHVGVKGLGLSGAGNVVGTTTDNDIWGALDCEQAGKDGVSVKSRRRVSSE